MLEEERQEKKCPPHHWIIDSYNFGKCINCSATRDFAALLKKRYNEDWGRKGAIGAAQERKAKRRKRATGDEGG